MHGNDPVYPVCRSPEEWHDGITLREHFAGLAMQGIIFDEGATDPAHVVRRATACADCLLAELAKEVE